MSIKKPVVLISGANAGIGLATAIQLAKNHDYHVIIGSRDAAAGQQAAAEIVSQGASASAVQLDITSSESITNAVATVERDFGVLDVLINNAGVMFDYVAGANEAHKNLSIRDVFTRTFDANLIGAACLTEECVPLLRKAEFPRLVFVSSRMGSLVEAQNKSNLWYPLDYKAYDCSKAALNMLTLNYARNLEDCGAAVNAVCPGLIKTKLTNHHPYGGTTDEGAQRIVELATASKGSPTATLTDRNGTIPW